MEVFSIYCHHHHNKSIYKWRREQIYDNKWHQPMFSDNINITNGWYTHIYIYIENVYIEYVVYLFTLGIDPLPVLIILNSKPLSFIWFVDFIKKGQTFFFLRLWSLYFFCQLIHLFCNNILYLFSLCC